ncbi:MAG: type VI secretion system protein TssA [Rhodospirillales bacterium]|nr:type VI secretion system protein TssA [Rhodospirillales bacterium]
MALDLDAWAAPLSEDAPCGPSLEFDADFGALDRAAQGKPEQQYGTTIIPAEEPDWKDTEAQASALMARTRDLRVLGHLAVARLHQGALGDYAALVGLGRRWVEERWDSVHPQLDPEDDNDPTLRGNALLQLAHPAWVVRYLRDLPLVRAPRVGNFSWRHIAVATGQVPPAANEEPATEAAIHGAFKEGDAGYQEATHAALLAARAAFKGISDAFDAAAGAGSGPNFEDIDKLLHEMARMMDRFAPAADEVEPGGEAATDQAADTAAPGAAPAARAAGANIGTITSIPSRTDALRLLDLVVEFYNRTEPSSPVPLLIARARRLAEMSFIDVLQELAPDGINQARQNTGAREQ